jgi:riboflavin kinase / FMN adenylyltransferase
MNTFFGIKDLQKITNAVVTIGTFDGVHLGHQKILNRLKETAQSINGQSVVVTFYPHPRSVVSTDAKEIKLLTTIDEKIELFERFGIENVVVVSFNREFSELTSEQFIEKYLIEAIGTKHLVIGYDHRFGRNREGGFEFLKANSDKYGFDVEEITRQDIENIAVSSTRIRTALQEGNIPVANHFLGRQYSLSGVIVKGKQIGRTIGIPTANIQVRDTAKLVPTDGVYGVWVNYRNDRFGGMMNIGSRPTVDGTYRTIEVNIFDFDKDIYGENLTVEFVEKVRNEQKFSGLEELKSQIIKDKASIEIILNK